jgi:hypothetical protein
VNRPKQILVLANETLAGDELRAKISELVRIGHHDVHVTVPALSSRFRYFMSDVDGPRSEARARLDASLVMLEEMGVQATGSVGDADPVRAFRDITVMFVPDHIVISTHPPGRSNWLEKNVVERVRELANVPVDHVVVDLEAAHAAARHATA